MRRTVYNSPNNPDDNQYSNSNDGTGGLPISQSDDGTGGLPEGWRRSTSPSDNPSPRLTTEEILEQQRIENKIRENNRRRRLEPSNGQAGGTENQWGNSAGAFSRSVRPRIDSSQQCYLNFEPNGPIPVNQDPNPIGDQNDMQQDTRSNNVQNQGSFNELAMDQTTTQKEVRSIFEEQIQIHNQAMQQHQQAMQYTNHQIREVLNETRVILDQIQVHADRPLTPIGHINLQEALSTPPNQIVPIRPVLVNRNPEKMGRESQGGREDHG